MDDKGRKAGASERTGAPDVHVDEQSGTRVPTPDPKDQTGDPDADNPAMKELRKRQSQGNITES